MARLEVVWRRLPLTSTSVWFGLRPRSFACSVWFAMSPPKACAVNDGTTFASEFMRSGLPADSSSAALSTCTGEALVYSSSPVVRVPVTITVSDTSLEDASASASSWAYSTAGVHARLTANDSSFLDIKTSLGVVFSPDATRRIPSPLPTNEADNLRCCLLGIAQGERPARVSTVLQ